MTIQWRTVALSMLGSSSTIANLLPFRHGRFGLFPGQARPMIDLRYSIYDRGRVRCDLLIGEVRRDIGKPSITVFQVSGSGGRR